MEVTIIFTAVLTLIFLFHSARVVLMRQEKDVWFGAGNDEELTRRIRIHGNFAEYMPLALLVMLALENYATQPWVWAFGLVVVLGRLLHAYGLWSRQTPLWARIAGMALTFCPLALGSVYVLWVLVF